MSGELIEVGEARARVLAAVERLPEESVGLAELTGRVLAAPVHAGVALPGFDNSAMDGYAVRAGDVAQASTQAPVKLAVVGESRAGHPAGVAAGTGEAVAISTGAMIPEGADAVVRVEDTEGSGATVAVQVPVAAGANIRRAGEDVEAGSELLAAGVVVGAAEAGALAAVGRAEAVCSRRPRIALVSTGDELTRPGTELRPGGVYNSNSVALRALAAAAGAEVVELAVVGDEAGSTREALGAALADVDVLAVCGGVSVGRHDHVRPALEALGVEQSFWGVALKPGKPTYFGTLDRDGTRRLVFGLPGNPVSALVTFLLFARPALVALQGADPGSRRLTARLTSDYKPARGRAEAIRVRLAASERGWLATPTGAQGSHVLTSMIGADGLAIAPAGTDRLAAGEKVEVELLTASGGLAGGGSGVGG